MVSKTKMECNRRYIEKNYTQIGLRLKNKDAEMLKSLAKEANYSVSSYILLAVKEKMLRDGLLEKEKYSVISDGVEVYTTNDYEEAEKRVKYENDVKHPQKVEIVEN